MKQRQQRSQFSPGNPLAGYYNDLRPATQHLGSATEARHWLEVTLQQRERVSPVTIVQAGLGAWQRAHDTSADAAAWRDVAHSVAQWVCIDMDCQGRLAIQFDMPHTFNLAAPWYSAMAQGEAISLLIRCGHYADAARAAQPLLLDEYGLRADTPDGVILQEYPTTPPAHVLNGWIFALWGLYDLAHAPSDASGIGPELRAAAREEWHSGLATLAVSLPGYELRGGWSRYDSYPHPLPNVASPFYHALHVALLDATAELARADGFTEFADACATTAQRWGQALASPVARVQAVARKGMFRLRVPRRRSA